MGDFKYHKTVKTYIQMALAVGVEHYTVRMEEIVALDKNGIEAGRFKSLSDAHNKLGIDEGSISSVMDGNRQTAGGLKWMRVKDYELIEREPEKGLTIIPLK
jgi:hypothetical protein